MIELGREDAQVFRVDGGWFSFLEFENDLWVMNVRAETRGSGNRILHALMDKARELGKNLHGRVNRMSVDGMDNRRLARWYERNGGTVNGGHVSWRVDNG